MTTTVESGFEKSAIAVGIGSGITGIIKNELTFLSRLNIEQIKFPTQLQVKKLINNLTK